MPHTARSPIRRRRPRAQAGFFSGVQRCRGREKREHKDEAEGFHGAPMKMPVAGNLARCVPRRRMRPTLPPCPPLPQCAEHFPHMKKPAKATIEVKGVAIGIVTEQKQDYICLTDIAKFRDSERTDYLISNWMRNRNTIEFLGIWERLHNPSFNPIEFDGIRIQAGLNSFILTARQWIERTGAIGIVSKAGRYGGTYAHRDIAFEFAAWISVEFKLYLIKEFQRLKEDESRRLSLAWNLNRTLSKLNYRIHTDAVRTHLIPPEVTPAQAAATYASEADLLNVALFGHTARQWRDANPKLDGNMRDHATIEQLLVLANLESLNAELIHMALPTGERLAKLNAIAIRQMRTLTASAARLLEN
jgi:hypothetical protein